MRRPVRAARAVAIGALAAALAIGVAAPASAHSVLIGSTPAAGTTLEVLPEHYSVTMNERLLADAGTSAFALRVRDAAGLYYGDGCLQVDGETMSTAAAIGEPGDYVLEWQLVSADGHPLGGEIPFTWSGEATSEGSATPPSCGAEPSPDDGGTASESPGADSEHGGAPAGGVSLVDVAWIVGAVLVVGVAVTIALVASRRRA